MAPQYPTFPLRTHAGVAQWLIAEIERTHGWRATSAEQSFEDIGLKALDFIELVITAETHMAIELPDAVALPCKTPAELAARIVERMPEARGLARA